MNSLDKSYPRLTLLYLAYIQDHDIRAFVSQVTRYYTESALERLTQANCVLTRRAAAAALGFVGTYETSNKALAPLLHDPDRTVSLIAESSMKAIWSREGTGEQRKQLCSIMRHIAAQEYGEAVQKANTLLEEFPRFIEARNQRAIALFALQRFEEAVEDCEMVLRMNPYHFGAVVSFAHTMLQMNDLEGAVILFQKALAINPLLVSVRKHLAMIKQSELM